MRSEKALTVLLWIVGTGFFMQTLDSTVLNTALPEIANNLGRHPLHMQPVVLAYSLAMVMVIPASGWLADRLGTRCIFLIAVALFTVGSIGCAISRTLDELVMARVVQGLGGGILLPAGRLAILRTHPPSQYLHALGFVAIPGLLGSALGPAFGGWIVSLASWRWIFWVNVPIGMTVFIAAQITIQNIKLPTQRFDLNGYMLFAACVLTLLLALNGLANHHLSFAVVLVLLGISSVTLIAYGRHAAHTDHPLFPFSLFAVRTYRIGLLGNGLTRMGGDALPYMIPLLLQLGLGYAPYEAGLMMLSMALAAMGAKRFVNPLITNYGYRRILVGNSLLIASIIASFSLVSPEQPVWLRIVQLAAFGGFYSIQATAMSAATLKDLVGRGASSGNGLFATVQMLAMSLGVTVASILLDLFQSLFTIQANDSLLPVFKANFICVGLIIAGSACIFWQLKPNRTVNAAPCCPTNKGAS
ncbi:MFS transporter [Mycetohabitans endofungorum]|uniref:MFS transporter n=1 Tax=Mycetohabitans endofungorum TaxID=417203 RepID=UPI002B0570BC|nr:MFS transporter [Mycetohabitans endofungorum]